MNIKPRHILFIGIAGHAMRGIALAAQRAGHTVTGLDESSPEGDAGGQWVTDQGIEWTRTPDPKLLDSVDLVIISGGIAADYPLVVEAQKRAIPVQSFAEYLGELTKSKHVIAVGGTHGKTTTTALIAWLLESAGRRPDFLVGIRPFNFDSSARLDGADTFVVEGDEYKASSLNPQPKLNYYHPDTLVLTSAEHDHPDLYPDLASVVDAFKTIVSAIPPAGHLIAWAESDTVAEIAKSATCDVVTYGLEKGDYTPHDIKYLPAGIQFDIIHGADSLGRVTVPLYGKHNVLNALAAAAAATIEGLTSEQIIAGAATFKGAYRRFNILTAPDAAVTVIDDYAHHPTEVATTLEAAKLHYPGRRIVAVFRPHTYSRTKALLAQYQAAFGSADAAYITDVEAAREATAGQTVSGRDIVAGLKIPAHFVPERRELAARLKADTQPGDVLVCMTVSGYDNLAESLAKALN